jgi:hypothetical protein
MMGDEATFNNDAVIAVCRRRLKSKREKIIWELRGAMRRIACWES